MNIYKRNGTALGANRVTIPTSITADWVQNGNIDYKVREHSDIPSGVLATGGWVNDIIVGPSTYRVHIFYSSGDIIFSTGGNVEVLVVGGGGSGGRGSSGHGGAGGGGGGGIQYSSSFAVTATTYAITIGAGGLTPNPGVNSNGNPGGSSIFSTLTAGGGLGGVRWNNPSGNGGASGTPQSYAGGVQNVDQGGGGGGAAGIGGNGIQASSFGGAGGIGISYNITGTAIYYGAGGGGGGGSRSDIGTNNNGLGRQVNIGSNEYGVFTPLANSGGGGPGAYAQYNAGSGADGIVVVRYII